MKIYHLKNYLDMIRPYLRDLINYHTPTKESNNEENEENDSNADCAE